MAAMRSRLRSETSARLTRRGVLQGLAGTLAAASTLVLPRRAFAALRSMFWRTYWRPISFSTSVSWRGSALSFGDFGLKAMECGWITDRQIEAARIAMTRYIKRGGKVGSGCFRISRSPRSLRKLVWVREKAHRSSGSL